MQARGVDSGLAPSSGGSIPEHAQRRAAEEVTGTQGLVVTTPSGEVGIAPAAGAPGSEVQSGVVLHQGEHADSVMTTTHDTAPAAGYVVIADAAAPTQYRFSITAAGTPAQLHLTERGSALVEDVHGDIVETIAPPWARDSRNRSVDTWYSVAGNVPFQNVSHDGAAYPVVADPSLECDAAFCTVLYSRSDTERLATEGSFAGAALAAACGASAWACGLGVGIAVDAANRANNEGKCVGIRHLYYSAVASFPVVEPCKE